MPPAGERRQPRSFLARGWNFSNGIAKDRGRGRSNAEKLEETVRQGHFEDDPHASERKVFRLRWDETDPLSDEERNYARFVRYLVTVGRLSELTERPQP